MDTNLCQFTGFIRSGLVRFETCRRSYLCLVVWCRQESRRGTIELPLTALVTPEIEDSARQVRPWDEVLLDGRFWLVRRRHAREQTPVILATGLKKIGTVRAPRGYR